MNLRVDRALLGRFVLPLPSWVHIHVYCVVYQGNAYLKGSVTGNFGRPVPGVVVTFGRGDTVLGALTSNESGKLDGPIASADGAVGAPPRTRRIPMQCVVPKVKVGSPSRAKVNPPLPAPG